ncbi:MAG: DUF2877 domain-containing protein [Actinomycetota bacterium]
MTVSREPRFTGHAIAAPLADLLDRRVNLDVTVLGSSSTCAYLAAGDEVVAVTAGTIPRMPNGVAVIESRGLEAFDPGAQGRMSSMEITAGRVVVSLNGTERHDPAVPRNEEHDATAVTQRGRDLLAAAGFGAALDPPALLAGARPELTAGEGLDGARALLAALERRDIAQASEAARLLTGRGPGLTPDGDDLLAAAAACTFAFGRPTGLLDGAAASLRAALLLDDLDARTTGLSASLLRLAARGQVIDPVRALLDLTLGRATWTKALHRLERIGHGTGGTYVLGCALSALALAGSRSPVTRVSRREETI